MMKKIAIALTGCLVAASAFAWDDGGIVQSIALRDGSTVHVFDNGKMAMENQYGLITSMKEGQVMKTKDGKDLVMNGNETARLYIVLGRQYRGN